MHGLADTSGPDVLRTLGGGLVAITGFFITAVQVFHPARLLRLYPKGKSSKALKKSYKVFKRWTYWHTSYCLAGAFLIYVFGEQSNIPGVVIIGYLGCVTFWVSAIYQMIEDCDNIHKHRKHRGKK